MFSVFFQVYLDHFGTSGGQFFWFSRRRQVRTQRETSLGEVEFSRRASVVEVTEGKFWS